jgi:O-antigen ligase
MIMSILIGVLGASLAAILLLTALKAGVFSGHEGRGPSFVARVFTLWVASTVFFGGYFGSIRFFGLFDLTVERAIFLVLLVAMARMAYRGRVAHGMNPVVDILMAVFLCLCLVSMTIHGFFPSHTSFAKPWFIFLEGYLLPFFSFYCVKYFLVGEEDDRFVMKGLFWMGVAVVVISLMEGFGLRQYVFPRYIADKTILLHLDRARGPLLNAAFSGLALCIGLVAGLTLIPLTRFPGRLAHFALLTLFPLAIYFTRTRSVYLQFLIVVLGAATVLRTSFPKWKVYAIPAFLVAMVVLANVGRFATAERTSGGLAEMREVSIRFELANKSVAIISQWPFFGVGLAQFRSISQSSPEETEYQHNHLIGMAAELGLVGLMVYMGILSLIWVRLFKLFSVLPEGRFVNANFLFLVGLALLCNLVSNTFVEPALIPFANINFFLFAGIVDRLYNRYARTYP